MRMAHEECSNKRHNATICRQTVGNGPHSVFTHTVSYICTSVTAQSCIRWLEIDASFDLGQVAASQISRSSKKIGEARSDG